MENGIIYRAYDSQGKSYIGQTTKGLEHRKKTHWYTRKSNNIFHKAILEKGLDEFKWEVLEENIPEDKLLEREKYWVAVFNSQLNGYNGKTVECIPRSVLGMKGKHHTEETKKKISDSHIGIKPSEESKLKNSIAHLGNTHAKGHSLSEEKRVEIGEKVSKALKGKPKSKEHNLKVSKALKGKPKSEEHKQKLREAWKKRKGEN